MTIRDVAVRAGVSGDGRQGFTFGFMTLTRPDSSQVPMKYLAYWRKDGNAWKVIAYKRVGRPAGPVSSDVMSSSLRMPSLTRLDPSRPPLLR